MTVREELDAFINRADELIDSKYILADIKIVNLLRTIASSKTIVALFKNCLNGFDYEQAKKKYLVKNSFLSEDKGEFILPPNTRELLAFVFNVIADIEAKRIDFAKFINKYFYVDGSFVSAYDMFLTAMIKPFKNSVKMLLESVIEGRLQDPLEALVQAEEMKIKQKELEEQENKKNQELMLKAYGESIKKIKDILLKNKQKIKESKKSEQIKNEITLIIDMLANVVESEDKDAIEYALIAYKYVAKANKIIFFGSVKKIKALVKEITK